jgi:hypothetical protein
MLPYIKKKIEINRVVVLNYRIINESPVNIKLSSLVQLMQIVYEIVLLIGKYCPRPLWNYSIENFRTEPKYSTRYKISGKVKCLLIVEVCQHPAIKYSESVISNIQVHFSKFRIYVSFASRHKVYSCNYNWVVKFHFWVAWMTKT